jgi:hypothetical protein
MATEDGFKRIDEIRIGDKVWSYNVETGEKSLKKVKQVFVKESNEILHLETIESEIDATTNHPFYVTGKGWVAAGDLVVGDEVHTLNGDTDTVTGFKLAKLDKPISVYNLEIEDFQTYFVEDLLVHNYSLLEKLKKKGFPVPKGEGPFHGHHILPKVGLGIEQKDLLAIGQEILRGVGIDPIHGQENLVIAGYGNGVHSTARVLELVASLCLVRGDRDLVIAVLSKYGKMAQEE